jgi:hypothetical protein
LTYAITRYFRPAGHHDDEAGWWFPLPRLPARIDPPHRVGDAGWITQRFAPDADD